MKDFLGLYQQKGLIKKEKIGIDQISKYIKRAQKDLKVANANLSIDTEAAYNYAYLAMLRTGRALMYFRGFRPADGQQHKTVVEFCEYLLGKNYADLVQHFDKMRKKRNLFTYDEPGLLVSETETENAFETAKIFVKKVSEYIEKQTPQRKLWRP